MAIKTPANLRAWAKASPEELRELEAEDALYRAEGMNREDDESVTAGENDETPTDTADSMPVFDPQEIEARAYELADEIEQGEGEEELWALMEDYDPLDGAPRWVGDAELWDGATELTTEVREPDEPTFWVVVAHVYDAMSGPRNEPSVEVQTLTPPEA